MILDTLAQAARKRVESKKAIEPLDEITRRARAMAKGQFEFEKALSGQGISFICEVKKASPSKGVIAEQFPYTDIAAEYQAAGAAAISVLTAPEYFLGRDEYLAEISGQVTIPVLRKDFTVDAYQIYEAKLLGASAVLLICALLNTAAIARYIGICDELGLTALVEAHTEDEIQSALRAGARVIGVNNRDLKTFEVDITLCEKMRELVPADKIFVAESGIKTPGDIARLSASGVNAVLIGETLMREKDKRAALVRLRGGN